MFNEGSILLEPEIQGFEGYKNLNNMKTHAVSLNEKFELRNL